MIQTDEYWQDRLSTLTDDYERQLDEMRKECDTMRDLIELFATTDCTGGDGDRTCLWLKQTLPGKHTGLCPRCLAEEYISKH